MRAVNYYRPNSLAEAIKALKDDAEARLLAGGQTLLPTLKLRLAAPSLLVDLQGLAELRGIAVVGKAVRVGAMTTHAQLAHDAQVQRALPGLANLAADIGDRMVRNMGTVGGSVANSDPSADYPAALLALDGTVITNGRRIPAGQFFRGLYETALEAGEIVTGVEFAAVRRSAYLKFRSPASRYAIVGVFIADAESGPRVAVTGAASSAFRVPEYEAALNKGFRANALDAVAASFPALGGDVHASSEYRADLIPIIARRALAALLAA